MSRPHSPRDAARSQADHDDPAGADALTAFDLVALASPSAVYATLLRDARRGAGVSTAELARRAGVPEQVVELWEDPTWEGHSLSVLRRVAKALDLRLELRLAPARVRRGARADQAVAA